MAASTSTSAGESFLCKPDEKVTTQPKERVSHQHESSDRFVVVDPSYSQQFSDMYFLRLAKLKPILEEVTQNAWEDYEVDGQKARPVTKALDVRPGEICWVTGTIYMDMPLKPNILEDIQKEMFTDLVVPAREKYTDNGISQTMLEDESGRLVLSGKVLSSANLVTGVIVSLLGQESSDGTFEVIDYRLPELPLQKPLSPESIRKGKKIAFASGLLVNGSGLDGLNTHLLVDYLLGEAGGSEDHEEASQITRLVLCGNSIGAPSNPVDTLTTPDEKARTVKKYGYDASAYNPSPTAALDNILTDLLTSLHVTILPGELDPANVSMPQQQLHSALFNGANLYNDSTFERATNPWQATVDGVSIIATSGQNLDDVYKYLEGDDRLNMCEQLLRWRNIAPTAPDTLWSYPFQDREPFVLGEDECPHLFVIGNQPSFKTSVVHGNQGQTVRVVLLPKFEETGEIVVVDLETLETEVVGFKVVNA
ncbi:DNA polymerase alpha/epsilon subunit B-domain-containing protein [Pyronema omphalodes]|nr:DNA polymerase alpha/epsilon subunit B-domain-containing protein [Pyronema omphalodes]